jgi:predicted MFS family arabinose efflux permease
LLPSRPAEARFLTTDEKQWLQEELRREESQKLEQRQYSLVEALIGGRVWYLVLVYFGLMCGDWTLNAWGPQLVKSLSSQYSNTLVGLLLVIPNLAALVAMIIVSRSSDRRLERRYHVAVPALASAVALALLGATPSAFVSMTLLCILAAGIFSCLGPFWALPSEFLTGYSAAAGIALINSVGNLAGFVSPVVIGFAAERTGSVAVSMALAAAPVFIAAMLVFLLPNKLGRWVTA